jgi:Domain of unknown function (DUF1877)
MSGEYLRVIPDELTRALADPQWALELAEEVRAGEEETDPPPGEARHLSTDKAWHAIAFLLERAAFPWTSSTARAWDEPDSLGWVRDWYEPLIPDFTGAAKRGQALTVWLD